MNHYDLGRINHGIGAPRVRIIRPNATTRHAAAKRNAPRSEAAVAAPESMTAYVDGATVEKFMPGRHDFATPGLTNWYLA